MQLKRAFSLPLTAFALLCAASHAQAANIVTNGSFELGTLGIGSFQGWQTSLGDSSTYVDSSGKTGTLYGQAFNGLWAAYFGSTSASGGSSISQTLATTANQTYVLSFELANDNGGLAASNSFAASLNGLTVLSFSNLANQNYVYQQYIFVASSTSTLLSFAGYNNQSYLELDNVAVAPVPEASSFALVLSGLLSAGLAINRPRRQP